MRKINKISHLIFQKNNQIIHKLFENEENKINQGIDIELGKNVKLNLSPNFQEKLLEKAQDVLKDFDFNFQLYDNIDTINFKDNFLQTWKEEIGVDTLQNSLFNALTPTFKIKLDKDHFIKTIEIDLYRIKNDLGHDEAGALIKFQL